MDREFENEQDTLQENLEKRGTPKDAIKIILDRRREGYEASMKPREYEARVPSDPKITKWEGRESFVGSQGYPVYCDGILIGVLKTTELAELAIAAHNATLKKRSFTI